ncbi:EGF-like domain-containing protein [Nephila pilipes]|uniref:EGF-like domain-containing protein n=1 Tax=Nephila pilipes TaxID=299642 RepID=A0A8X6NZ95_NEPPI|nr:EGF-like domain-containing protein [Nephila pilipes]
MGKVYSGEEIIINVENFLTLPESGNYVFEWMLEGNFRKTHPLPANFKLSISGRSIVVKELKKIQAGVIVCVVYSPTGMSVAKRRFSIKKVSKRLSFLERISRAPLSSQNLRRIKIPDHSPDEEFLSGPVVKCAASSALDKLPSEPQVAPSDRRRSLLRRREQQKWAEEQKRNSPYYRCVKSLSDLPAEDLLKLSSKPISRKKRFRKALAKEIEKINRVTRDCKRRHLHNRIHARWAIPFFSGYETTSDPRVMSIHKLVELSENSDGTLDNLIPREIHYVEPVVSVVTDYFRSFLKPPDIQPNCSIDSDCGEGAMCVIPLDQDGSSKMDNVGRKGYCYCKPEYFGDGFTCTKIPGSYHRDKRVKRRSSRKYRESKTTANLLYQYISDLPTDIPFFPEKEIIHSPSPLETSGAALLMQYEDEDSYLVSKCTEKKDCNQHAFCYEGKTGHPFCRCNPGYRGNGIFCWEMIDYIPAKDQGTDKAPD